VNKFHRINKLAYLSFFSKADTFFVARSQLVFSAASIQNSEPVFLKVYGAQESIPRNEFRQPM
jgi:hypothetical protein